MRFTRRLFVAGALAAPFVTGRAAIASEDTQGPVRNNISAFRTHEWQDHFDALGVGIIISDTTAKVLQHWTPDGQMYLYPTSVPLSDELTRRGYTEVVEKKVNPSWAPTPSGPAPVLFRSRAHARRPFVRRPLVSSSRGLNVSGAGCRSR